MLISIITVCYNSEKYICDVIKSVLAQNYHDIEYIIIDGASKDNTVSIIKSYESKFNGRLKWISEPDKGIYDAMNKGIMMASGDIVGILNSDDIFIDKFVIEDIVKSFTENSDCDAIYGNLYYVDKNDVTSIVRDWEGSQYHLSSFKKGWHPAHPTFYVKRKSYLDYGLYDTSLKVSADFELMLRFIEKYRINTYYLDRYFVKMRTGGESTGSIKRIIIGNLNILEAFKKNDIDISPLYMFKRILSKAFNLLKYRLK